MQIQVATLTSKTLMLNVSPRDSIANIKFLIYNEEDHMLPHMYRLKFNGNFLLEENRTLQFYGIGRGDMLRMSFGLAGGAPKKDELSNIIRRENNAISHSSLMRLKVEELES
eukprot:6007009-Heterocapsa_arctica.AAC.1